MKSATDTRHIFDKLEAQHPGADTELHYSTPFQLLVATILSAQSTDQRVNMVTPALFKRYRDARRLARATDAELQPQIHSTGFFRAKSKSLIGMAQALVEQHGGEVRRAWTLVKLPGVGRRRTSCRAQRWEFQARRHVLRVASRIGIAESVLRKSSAVVRLLPPKRWTLADLLILHGRRIRRLKLCGQCAVQDDCDYFAAIGGDAGGHCAGPAGHAEGRLTRRTPRKKTARARE
jgi:endonuclease-3